MLPVEQSDAKLLQNYVSDQSEDSFKIIVSRHGTTVFGICRRMLGNIHDAEDATQAVFLTLAQKSKSIQRTQSLSAWLHRVSVRICWSARKLSTKTKQVDAQHLPHQSIRAERSEGNRTCEWESLKPLLDEAINQLPEKYRLPLVLHHFQGHTQEATSKLLGCNYSTLTMRLHRARTILRNRLNKKGSVLSASSICFFLSKHYLLADPVPGTVATTIVKAVTGKVFAGVQSGLGTTMVSSLKGHLISQETALLTKGILKIMFFQKLKATALILTAVSIMGVGIGLITTNLIAKETETIKPSKRKSKQNPKESIFIQPKDIQFQLVRPDKEKRHGIFATGSFKASSKLSPAMIFTWTADNSAPKPNASSSTFVICKMPFTILDFDFLVANKSKIVIKEKTINISVQIIRYTGPIKEAQGPLEIYTQISLPKLPMGNYKTLISFEEKSYEDQRNRADIKPHPKTTKHGQSSIMGSINILETPKGTIIPIDRFRFHKIKPTEERRHGIYADTTSFDLEPDPKTLFDSLANKPKKIFMANADGTVAITLYAKGYANPIPENDFILTTPGHIQKDRLIQIKTKYIKYKHPKPGPQKNVLSEVYMVIENLRLPIGKYEVVCASTHYQYGRSDNKLKILQEENRRSIPQLTFDFEIIPNRRLSSHKSASTIKRAQKVQPPTALQKKSKATAVKVVFYKGGKSETFEFTIPAAIRFIDNLLKLAMLKEKEIATGKREEKYSGFIEFLGKEKTVLRRVNLYEASGHVLGRKVGKEWFGALRVTLENAKSLQKAQTLKPEHTDKDDF